MHIDKANLINLTGLWKKYGSLPISGDAQPLWHANTHWPHRCWLDCSTEDTPHMVPNPSSDITWLEDVPKSTVLPLWPMASFNETANSASFEQCSIEQQLLDKRWTCAFEQMAMYMKLEEGATYSPLTRPGLQVMQVRTPNDINIWVEIASEAFGYHIDRAVIENLIHDKSIRILLGYQGGQAVASALLYKTGDIIGVHQMGVKQAFQGQGIARCFMHEIIATCAQWQCETIVLQASQAGQPLYESLGFRAQFTIKNYRRVSL